VLKKLFYRLVTLFKTYTLKKNIPILLSYLLIFCYISCTKSNSGNTITPPVPPTDSTSNTLGINVSYPMNANSSYNDFELIINTDSGNILLDTISKFNTIITATLHTDKKFLNVATVLYNTSLNEYVINVYRDVNPSLWDKVVSGVSSEFAFPDITGTPVQASIHYSNAPPDYNTPIFSTYANSITPSATPLGSSIYDFGYQLYPDGYTYFLLPGLSLCKLYLPKSNADTVDLSKMDTVIKLNFNKPSTYKITNLSLKGTVDTTNFATSVILYSDFNYNFYGNIPDIFYPEKLIQLYRLSLSAQGTTNTTDFVHHFSYGDTITSSLPFPDESYYSIVSNQNDNFSVSFLKNKPTYYETVWTNSNVSLAIYSSPDSNQLHAFSLVSSLHSQLLQGTSLSNLNLTRFIFENAEALDYPSYSKNFFNSQESAKRLPRSTMIFTKTF
jgi:hypothetical protein